MRKQELTTYLNFFYREGNFANESTIEILIAYDRVYCQEVAKREGRVSSLSTVGYACPIWVEIMATGAQHFARATNFNNAGSSSSAPDRKKAKRQETK